MGHRVLIGAEILERLLALNEERARGESLASSGGSAPEVLEMLCILSHARKGNEKGASSLLEESIRFSRGARKLTAIGASFHIFYKYFRARDFLLIPLPVGEEAVDTPSGWVYG
jgi:hypothetical protein